MSVACDCGYYEGGAAEVFREDMVVARKPRTCCECYETIKPGQIYERAKGKWDGDWGEYHTCRVCAAIRNDYCCQWTYGELRNSIWNCLGFDYTGQVADDFEGEVNQ